MWLQNWLELPHTGPTAFIAWRMLGLIRKSTVAERFVWIREPSIRTNIRLGGQVSYYTPISRLNGEVTTPSCHIVKMIVGIDGGAVYGGHLLAVRY